MYKIIQKNARVASRLMAIAAAGLLLTYMLEATEQRLSGAALPATDHEVEGAIFGVSSVVLFVAAFVLELRERSLLTSGLLISGGATMGTLAIVRDMLAEAEMANISTNFANASSVGYVIMALGILHMAKLWESKN